MEIAYKWRSPKTKSLVILFLAPPPFIEIKKFTELFFIDAGFHRFFHVVPTIPDLNVLHRDHFDCGTQKGEAGGVIASIGSTLDPHDVDQFDILWDVT